MRPLVIYSFFIAVLGFSGLAYDAAFMAPKVTAMLRSVDSPFPLMSDSYQGLTWNKQGFYGALAGLAVSLAGLACGVFPQMWKRVSGRWMAGAGVVLSAGTMAWLAWESTSSFMAGTDLYYAGDRKARNYRQILEEFALVESAEGRIAATNERIRKVINATPQPITSAANMTISDAGNRLNQLLRMIESNQNPGTVKKGLATLPMFSGMLRDGTKRGILVLAAAKRVTGIDFESTTEFFKWVKTQESQGFTPITLYNIFPPATGTPGSRQ